MARKMALIGTMLVVALSMGAVVVAADDSGNDCQFYNEDEDMSVPGYCDGRINAFDIMQPVAIYYSHDVDQAVSGIELWTIDADGNGQLAAWVTLDEINAAMAAGTPVEIVAANGVSLNYDPTTNMFWVAAPNYRFAWDAW